MNRFAALVCVALAAAVIGGASACKDEQKKDQATDPAVKPADPAAVTPPAGDPAGATPPAGDPAAVSPPVGYPVASPPTASPPAAEPPRAAGPRPASVKDEHVKAADDFLASFDELVASVEQAKGNCASLIVAIKAQTPKLQTAMKAIEKMQTETKSDRSAERWFEATYKNRMTGKFRKLNAAIGPCKSNKDVQAALAAMSPRKVDVK